MLHKAVGVTKIGGSSFNPYPFGVPGSLREAGTASGRGTAEGTGAAATRSAAGTGYMSIDLSAGAVEGEEREVLRKRLTAVLDPIHRKSGQLDAVVDRVMDALRERLSGAGGAEALQIRFSSLKTDHGGIATVDQTVMEVGVVRDGKVAAADTALFGLDGGEMAMDAASIARAWRTGSFAQNVALPSVPEDAALKAARGALDRIAGGRKHPTA
jgi:hypothetical protein